MQQPNERLTVTLPEAARALGISRGLAYSLASRGKFPLPIIECGRRKLVPLQALDGLLEGKGAGCGHCQRV